VGLPTSLALCIPLNQRTYTPTRQKDIQILKCCMTLILPRHVLTVSKAIKCNVDHETLPLHRLNYWGPKDRIIINLTKQLTLQITAPLDELTVPQRVKKSTHLLNPKDCCHLYKSSLYVTLLTHKYSPSHRTLLLTDPITLPPTPRSSTPSISFIIANHTTHMILVPASLMKKLGAV
jgi:hypothetical protein